MTRPRNCPLSPVDIEIINDCFVLGSPVKSAAKLAGCSTRIVSKYWKPLYMATGLTRDTRKHMNWFIPSTYSQLLAEVAERRAREAEAAQRAPERPSVPDRPAGEPFIRPVSPERLRAGRA